MLPLPITIPLHKTNAATTASSPAPDPTTLPGTAAALDVAAEADALLAAEDALEIAELMLLVALATVALLVVKLVPVPLATKFAQLSSTPLLSATTMLFAPKYASVPLAVERYRSR